MTPEMNKIKILELNISTQHCFAVDLLIPLSGRLLYLGTFHRVFSSVWRSPCVSSTQHGWQHSSLAGDRRTQGCTTDQAGRVPQQEGRKFAYCDAWVSKNHGMKFKIFPFDTTKTKTDVALV